MLRRSLALLGMLVLIAGGPKEDAVKKEQEKLAGAWTVTAAEQEGQPLDRIKGNTLTINGDAFTILTKEGTEMKGTFELDPAKKPKTMDWKHTEGPIKDHTWRAIYLLDGDTLKICYTDPESLKEPPNEFSTQANDGRLLVVLMRD